MSGVYRIWYSSEAFAKYIIDNTDLGNKQYILKKMFESDANNSINFHTMPDHIKKILYLDAPDLIVEIDQEPIFSVEVTTEAGTGHNAFQRFARLSASVENNVPAFYIYPEAVIIERKSSPPTWDKINPLIFKALDDVMSIYKIPALLYYFPSELRNYPDASAVPNKLNKGLLYDLNIDYSGSPSSKDSSMQNMFQVMNDVIHACENKGIHLGRDSLMGLRSVIDQKSFMLTEYINKKGHLNMSPLSSTVKIPTEFLVNYLLQFTKQPSSIGELLNKRKETIIYKVNAKFRGDPYPGALSAIDYLMCREGKSFEERKYNLVLAWADVIEDKVNKTLILKSDRSNINDFIKAVQTSESKNILSRNYDDIVKKDEISRYYMQVRYGSTYSKSKHIRVYSYFADAILFVDGALWRSA